MKKFIVYLLMSVAMLTVLTAAPVGAVDQISANTTKNTSKTEKTTKKSNQKTDKKNEKKGDSSSVPSQNAGTCNGNFLGLKPWFAGLCENGKIKSPEGEDGINRFIWTIVANVMTDLFVILGYLTTGFIVWGGYLYMISRGDASKIASGKKTLMAAIIGFLISIFAALISNAIAGVLTGGDI